MLQIHFRNFCVSVVCMFVSLKFIGDLTIRTVLGDKAFRKCCHEHRTLMNGTRVPGKSPHTSPSPLVCHVRSHTYLPCKHRALARDHICYYP